MTERHRIVPTASQTRERMTASVSREGGGSVHPTLGGGCLVSTGTPWSGTARAAGPR